MKLIIARHVETVENQRGIVQGHLPGKLSKNGIEQVKKLAKRLEKEKIDIIFSSDLARAADTAKMIAENYSVPLYLTKKLRERSWGKIEGRRIKDVEHLLIFNRNDAESKESIMNRTKIFLADIQTKHSDKTILVVGHGGSVIALIANILSKTFDEVADLGKVDNGCITIFDPFPELKVFNCMSHLG